VIAWLNTKLRTSSQDKAYLCYGELKAKFRTIIVVQHWPKSILFQSFAKLSNANPHLIQLMMSEHENSNPKVPRTYDKLSNYLCWESGFTFTLFIFPSGGINVGSSKTSSLSQRKSG
jgi:uncharacterized protein YozE (UPF0346 family)